MKMQKMPGERKLQQYFLKNREKIAKLKEQGIILMQELTQAALAGGTAFLYGATLGYIKQNAENNNETDYFDGKILKAEDGTGGVDVGLIAGALGVAGGAYMVSQKKRGSDIILGLGTGMLVPALHDLGYGIGMDFAKKS